jgi:hypothetical protein
MTLTIELTPREEARLVAAARRAGLEPQALARKLVTQGLPDPDQHPATDPTLALFAQWDEEDAAMTPEEAEAARRDFEEFKQNLNDERARAGARIMFP